MRTCEPTRACCARRRTSDVHVHSVVEAKYNVVTMPKLIGEEHVSELAEALSACCPEIDADSAAALAAASPKPYISIADTGAKDHNLTTKLAERFAIHGSWRRNTTVVNTANGPVTPPWRCDARLPVRFSSGRKGTIKLKDCFVNDLCQYVLVSTGRLAQQGVGTWHAPMGGDSFFAFPGGVQVSLIDMGVLILPDPNAPRDSAPAWRPSNLAVVQGGADRHATWDVLHNTFNHDPSGEKISNLWRCTSDGRKEWAKAVPKGPHPKACHGCLQGSADAIGPKFESMKAKQAGDCVGMDVWSVRVPHVHGGQTKVIGFHDYYSTLDKFYLIPDETSASCAKALCEFLGYCKSHGVSVKRIHTDNAQAFVGENTAMQKVINENCIRMTTISPGVPRQAGLMEKRWKLAAKTCRQARITAKMRPRRIGGTSSRPAPTSATSCPSPAAWTSAPSPASQARNRRADGLCPLAASATRSSSTQSRRCMISPYLALTSAGTSRGG